MGNIVKSSSTKYFYFLILHQTGCHVENVKYISSHFYGVICGFSCGAKYFLSKYSKTNISAKFDAFIRDVNVSLIFNHNSPDYNAQNALPEPTLAFVKEGRLYLANKFQDINFAYGQDWYQDKMIKIILLQPPLFWLCSEFYITRVTSTQNSSSYKTVPVLVFLNSTLLLPFHTLLSLFTLPDIPSTGLKQSVFPHGAIIHN